MRGGLSICQLGSAFHLIELLAVIQVFLLWMHLLVTVGFVGSESGLVNERTC